MKSDLEHAKRVEEDKMLYEDEEFEEKVKFLKH